MKRAIMLLVVAIVVPCCVSAQSWKYYRHEFSLQLGAANFLGELGGANVEGTNGIRDLEINLTRGAIGLAYRYKISPYVGWRSSIIYGRLKGNDNLTEEPFRNNRNLHFRSPIVELATIFELYFFKERTGHLYRFKGVKGIKGGFISPYFFGGVGGIYFSPTAEFNGQWHKLQPLGTEGQGIIPGKEKYNTFSVVIPYGIGVKYAIDKQWNIGIEYGLRLTFTDYMDDVSTDYYWNDQIQAKNGTMAAYFADPSLGNQTVETTTPEVEVLTGITYYPNRGDPSDNDTYMFTMITVSYKWLKGGFNLPKF